MGCISTKTQDEYKLEESELENKIKTLEIREYNVKEKIKLLEEEIKSRNVTNYQLNIDLNTLRSEIIKTCQELKFEKSKYEKLETELNLEKSKFEKELNLEKSKYEKELNLEKSKYEKLETEFEKVKEPPFNSEELFEFYTFEKSVDFSLKNQYIPARVVDIYDGDTITCVLNIFNQYFRFHIRLSEIDTCEMKSKEVTNKKLAYEARNRLFNLITSKHITENDKRKEVRKILNEEVYMIHLLCDDFDKYGRLLGWVFPYKTFQYDTKKSFNHQLINENLAYFYKGDTKLTEEEQINLMK